jgi:hypothetical protein
MSHALHSDRAFAAAVRDRANCGNPDIYANYSLELGAQYTELQGVADNKNAAIFELRLSYFLANYIQTMVKFRLNLKLLLKGATKK